MPTFLTRYAIGQKVLIVGLEDQPAKVRSVRITELGVSYWLTWFIDGKRCEEYVYEDELKPG